MNWFNNTKTGVKLIGGFLVVSVILAAVATVGYTSIRWLAGGMSSMYVDNTLPIQELGAAQSDVYLIRGDLYKYVLVATDRTATEQEIAATSADVVKQMGLFRAGDQEPEEQAALQAFDSAWTAYQQGAADVLSDTKAGNVQAAEQNLAEGVTHQSRQDTSDALAKLIDINQRQAGQADSQGAATSASSTRLIFVAGLLGVLAAIGLGIFITRGITAPLEQITRLSQQVAEVDLKALAGEIGALSRGDLTARLTITAQAPATGRHDEVGQMAQAFSAIIARLQETGEAFATMTTSWRNLVGHLADDATQVTSASDQLASAAEQSGSAINQVASTVQQVAQGTSSQASAATEVTASMDAMARKVAGIAQSAEQQTAAVERAGQSVEQLNLSLGEVAQAAAASAAAADRVAQSARGGAQVVQDTVQGMQAVHESTALVAGRVQEMGQRSEQIGQIVATIQEIADQTNLLALNAAIEAARGGEQGRGFAVVAEEVRKLAEKSGAASREIAELVRTVQKGTSEAVAATQKQAAEVSRRAEDARQAGRALDEILAATETNDQAAEQAKAAGSRMQALSALVVEALATVKGVAEENLAAAQAMAREISQVAVAVEGVAAAAEENSASVEEVSATTEELSAQVEQESAAAQELATLAESLHESLRQFKLSEEVSVDEARAECRTFRQAHLNWVKRAEEMLAGGKAIEARELASHTECALGRWYGGRGQTEFGDLPEFRALAAPHQAVHETVAQILAAIQRGDRAGAQSLLQSLRRASGQVVSLLSALEERMSQGPARQVQADGKGPKARAVASGERQLR